MCTVERVFHSIPYLPVLLVVFLLWSCSPAPAERLPPDVGAYTPNPSPSPSASATRAPAATSTDTATPVAPTATLESHICPPLLGYLEADLEAAVSNPYKPPKRPGSDDPHQAVDLAVEKYGMAVAGDPVQAMLDGVAAAVVADRFPYGNALLVEAPLEVLPSGWLEQMQAPTPAPTLGPHPALTCPQPEQPLNLDGERRSLYLLYAHLQEPPAFQLGESVECGQQIGLIGQSGNALAPHVHLEARVGPAGARFDSMAHYSGGITLQEMSNYCTWRVSGIFQLVDPMRLLALLP